MANRNVRVDERFEVSLGGVQIASIVVAALIALVIVFFLGVHTGERLGMRRAEALRPASLPELDAVSAGPGQKPVPAGELTYAAELPRAKPPPAPPPPPPRASDTKPAQPSASAPSVGAEPKHAVAVEPRHAVADAAESPPPAHPERGAGAAESKGEPAKPASHAWTVQLGASQNRAEAEELATKLARLGARIEEADIPGKGHYFRVRLGRFADRSAAEKYKADVNRETGLGGVLVPPGG